LQVPVRRYEFMFRLDSMNGVGVRLAGFVQVSREGDEPGAG
jgi:hypothetical protein